jgi:cell division transport system permease protein
MLMSRNKQVRRPKPTGSGSGGKLGYFVSRAVTNMRQNLFVNAVTIGTITLALLIFSLFLLVFANLGGAAEEWSKKMQVTIYFDRELAPGEVDVMRGRIQSLSGTDSFAYISREEALRSFRSRLKGQESLLDGVSADILPSSIVINLKRGSRTGESMEAYVAQLKKIPGMGEIQYGAEWVKRFTAFMNFARLVGLLLGSFLFLAVVFIVSNTIKLTIYARKDEIDILSLVGATRFFIKAPFLIEGVIQGAAGALFALLLLALGYLAFVRNAGNFLSFDPASIGLVFLSPSHLAGVFFGGIVLGFIGSLASLKRFISI